MTARVSVVVMGVSGCGKSTVGALLASGLGVPFVDGDGLHPPANIAKMSAGIPLTDDDRWPWLRAVAARLAESDVVIACSALRRIYRDNLRAVAPTTRFVLLDGRRELLAERMTRPGHFMPLALLDSQLATLERPDSDEHALVFDIAEPPERIASEAIRALRAGELALDLS